MGLFNKIKGEFIDIIEWLDSSNDTVVHRFDRYNNEIKMGAKLTVRESQLAVFINEGTIADIYEPGMHTLETENMPVLSTLKGWKYGFDSPFKAEVYFVNTKKFTDLKWGTPNPIMLRDPEFGPIRIRAFGAYECKIKDPVAFIKGVSGTDGDFTIDEVTDQLRNIIVTRFTDIIGEAKIPALDFAANYNEISDLVGQKIIPEYEEYGIELTKFLVSNISLPENVEEALDKRSSMGVVGDLGQYQQFQTAEAMKAAASNPGGGGASEGMGLGMGMAMANQMMNSMNQPQAPQSAPPPQAPPPPPPSIQFHVVVNGQQQGPYDTNGLQQLLGSSQLTKETLVWKQGMGNWLAAGKVPELMNLFAAVPPPPPPM